MEYSTLPIGRVIAQGGFGTVCESVHHGEVVAVKTRTLLESDAVSEMREFRREAWLSSSISHHAIVALRAITLSPPSLIMECILFHSIVFFFRQHCASDIGPDFQYV